MASTANSLPNSASAARRQRFRRILLVLASLAISAATLTHLHGRISLNRYRAKLIAAGEPLTLDPIRTEAPAEAYTKGRQLSAALAALRLPPTFPARFGMRFLRPGSAHPEAASPSPYIPDPRPTSWPEIDALLRPQRQTLAQVRELLAEPPLPANTVDYSQIYGIFPPHLTSIRSGTPVLALSILHKLHTQDLPAAHADHLALIRLPQVLHQDQLGISERISAWLQVAALHITWECLLTDGWTEAQLAAWQHAWDRPRPIRDLTRAIRTERACFANDIANARRFDHLRREMLDWGIWLPTVAPALPSGVAEVPSFLNAWIRATINKTMPVLRRRLWQWHSSYPDEERYLRLSQELIDTLENLPTSGQTFTREVRPIRTRYEETRPIIRRLVSERLTAWHTHFLETALRTEAAKRLLVTTIALRRYSLLHQQPAPSLAALVPGFLDAVPLDPMDGQPLRYRPSNKPIPELYSIGIDAIDDGGNPAPIEPHQREFLDGRDILLPQPANLP